jgi:hypothetical protein
MVYVLKALLPRPKPLFSLDDHDPPSTSATPEEEVGQGAEEGDAGKEWGGGGAGGRGD